MAYYAQYDTRNGALSRAECKCLSDFIENIEISKEIYDELEKYTYKKGKIVPDPDYEKKQAQKERERIMMLNLTAADVERGIYQALGLDFDDVVAMVEQLQPQGVDIKALKIELKANNFYRGNPYIDTIGTLLQLTSSQLDNFWETNDYHYLTKCTLTINPTPTEATITGNGTYPYGTTVAYKVELEGYKPVEGTIELVEDKTIEVVLDEDTTATAE